MTNLEAQAKDYAMSRKLNLSEPTDITHVIELIEKAYIAGSKGQWHDLRKNPRDLPTEECKDYLAIALDDTEPSLYMYLAGDDETEGQWEWEPRRIAVLSNDQIKAWCDFPRFEETEVNDKRSS